MNETEIRKIIAEIEQWEYPDNDEQGKIGYAMAIDDVIAYLKELEK